MRPCRDSVLPRCVQFSFFFSEARNDNQEWRAFLCIADRFIVHHAKRRVIIRGRSNYHSTPANYSEKVIWVHFHMAINCLAKQTAISCGCLGSPRMFTSLHRYSKPVKWERSKIGAQRHAAGLIRDVSPFISCRPMSRCNGARRMGNWRKNRAGEEDALALDVRSMEYSTE